MDTSSFNTEQLGAAQFLDACALQAIIQPPPLPQQKTPKKFKHPIPMFAAQFPNPKIYRDIDILYIITYNYIYICIYLMLYYKYMGKQEKGASYHIAQPLRIPLPAFLGHPLSFGRLLSHGKRIFNSESTRENYDNQRYSSRFCLCKKKWNIFEHISLLNAQISANAYEPKEM